VWINCTKDNGLAPQIPFVHRHVMREPAAGRWERALIDVIGSRSADAEPVVGS
jgi:hypothetical protein